MPTTTNGETNSNTVTVEDLNTALSTTDRSSRQKINKEKQALNDTGTERQLIFRVFHPKAAEYTFFSSVDGTFSRLITYWVKKQASVNLTKLKSY